MKQEDALPSYLKRSSDKETAKYVISKIGLELESKITTKLERLRLDIEKGFELIDERYGLTETERTLQESIIVAHEEVVAELIVEIRETLSTRGKRKS